MQLVGREPEITALAAALASAGEQPLVVVRGEAGIGKTRLVGVVREEAVRRGFGMLLGTAAGREYGVPAALFEQAGAGPEMDSGETREARWQRLVGTVKGLAERRPAVVLLDDVHWADPTSLELIDLLVRRPPAVPHVLLVSSRPGPEVDDILVAARAVGRATTLIDVAPLDRAASEVVLGPGWSAPERTRLVDLSGGNPLYLEELARSEQTGRDDALPAGIVAAITAELARLDHPAMRLAQAGALLGDPFDVDLARSVAGLESDAAWEAIDLLMRRGLLRGAGDVRAFSFRHPLVRVAVYESQPYAERVAGHADAARALTAVGAPLAQLAGHVAVTASAGNRSAARLLRRAAQQVIGSAPSIAADWLLAARRAAQDTDPALLSELAEALVQSGRLDEALAVAEDGLTTQTDPAVRARFTLVAAQVERLSGRQEEARRRLTRALTEPGPTYDRPRLKTALAVTDYERGDYEGMARWATEAAAESTDAIIAGVAASLTAVGQRFAGRPEDADTSADRIVAAVRGATAPELAAHADLLIAAGWALVAVERLEDALTVSRRTAEAAGQAHHGASAVPLHLAEVLSLALLGRIADADAAADRAEVAARLLHNDQSVQWALWMRAWVLLERGELDAALLSATESVDMAGRLDQSALSTIARTVRGAVLLAMGRPEEAEPLLAAYDVEPGWLCRWAPLVVEARLALGDRPAAEEAAARAMALAEQSGLAGALAAAHRARAIMDLDLNDALAAITYAESIGAQLDIAHGHLLAGRALSRSDRDAAAAHLTAALNLAEQSGARRTADMATRELRRLGRRVGRGGARGGPGGGVGSLSDREREIGELVAQGLTNKQIASRLFLSEKTVESHLSRAFAKLDVASRAALAARIAEDV